MVPLCQNLIGQGRQVGQVGKWDESIGRNQVKHLPTCPNRLTCPTCPIRYFIRRLGHYGAHGISFKNSPLGRTEGATHIYKEYLTSQGREYRERSVAPHR